VLLVAFIEATGMVTVVVVVVQRVEVLTLELVEVKVVVGETVLQQDSMIIVLEKRDSREARGDSDD
jgi:hypothetical protein